MNRLAPLITRSSETPHRARAWVVQPSYAAPHSWQPEPDSARCGRLADDLKLFATVWLAGVIFVGTLIA